MTRRQIGRAVITLPGRGAGSDTLADRRRVRLLAEAAWRAAANENADVRVPVVAEIDRLRRAGREPRRAVSCGGSGPAAAWPVVARLLARLKGTFRPRRLP
ncbi:hypothetical protein [Microbaculum marinum]|uniref:Uncharacterized protein n=1 Tax=Microbaculum marinum TaxID=1764581 RepID=A0AAW9RKD4_9HYPH